jgi:hypothetical protein
MARMPQVSARELVRFLKSRGFVENRQSGAHLTLRHPTRKVQASSGGVAALPVNIRRRARRHGQRRGGVVRSSQPIGPGALEAVPHRVYTHPISPRLPIEPDVPHQAFKPVRTNEPEPCSEIQTNPSLAAPNEARRPAPSLMSRCHERTRASPLRNEPDVPHQAFKSVRTNEPEPCSESKRTRASYRPPGAARQGARPRPRIPTVPWTTRTKG